MADDAPQKLPSPALTLAAGKVVPLVKAKRGRRLPLEDDLLRLHAFFRAERRRRYD